MKIVKLMGGVGNQMFQYAFGKALSIITGEEILFDKLDFDYRKAEEVGNSGVDKNGMSVRNYELDIFNFDIKFATAEQVKQCMNHRVIGYKIPAFIRKLFKIQKQTTNNILKENPVNIYHPELLETKGDAYYQGYFQCEKYFENIEEIIRKSFEFPPVTTQYNKDLVEKITAEENSVSIHVRRGDYLNLPEAELCTMDYYKRAADYIASKISNPKFFVFCAEDADWIQNSFDIGYKFELIGVENVGPQAYYENMRLMSLCKHNILANSSYSWWGAWLNNNPSKMVLTPDPWTETETNHNCDSWIKIKK